MVRKGMMVGSGKRGYQNIIGRDPAVHSQSARGMKQTQQIRMPLRPTKRDEEAFKIYDEYLKKAKKNREERYSPTELPIYKINGRFYFRDVRLGEYRDIVDPSHTKDINISNDLLEKPDPDDWKKIMKIRRADKEYTNDERLTYVGKDNWGRKIYKDNKTGRLFKDVDGVLHTFTKEGEPDTPVNKEIQHEYIKGGLADNIPETLFDKKELSKGRKVELEHTNNPEIAEEIARDHLFEDKDYYKKLEKMEKLPIKKAKNTIRYYNQDGQLMYRKDNQNITNVVKEIKKLKKQHLKWLAVVEDSNKGQYSIYYDNEGNLINTDK